MPGYPTLPAARRRHYEIDGTVVGYNSTGYGTGLTTTLSAANMLALNEETPSVNTAVISIGQTNFFIYMLFPELVDLSFFNIRSQSTGGGVFNLFSIQSSPDTTSGADGTWSTVGTSGAVTFTSSGAPGGDWWRSLSPGSLTSNNTGIKGLRFNVKQDSNNGDVRNVYVWGTKHAGQTPNDILFLQGDAVTEWPNDDDWGDVQAGTGFVTHTYYVKNTSSLTAHSVTVKASGSDSAQWTVSLDNVSFASSQSIVSIGPGASQIIYTKLTIPAGAAGNYRPYAAYIEADVASWS